MNYREQVNLSRQKVRAAASDKGKRVRAGEGNGRGSFSGYENVLTLVLMNILKRAELDTSNE